MDPFDWDSATRAANLARHGVGIDLVYQFDWSRAYFRPDRRFDYGEDRVIAYGRIAGRGYAIVYVRRGDAVRIIERPARPPSNRVSRRGRRRAAGAGGRQEVGTDPQPQGYDL